MKTIFTLAIFFCLSTLSAQTKVKSFYFLFDMNVPTEYSQNQLNLFAESVKTGVVKVIEINAFTDSSGTMRHNDTLSLERLAFVAERLPNGAAIKKNSYALDRPYQVPTALNWRRVDVIYEIEQVQANTEVASSNDTATPTEQEIKDNNEHLQNDPDVNKTVTSNAFEESMAEMRPLVLDISFKEGTAQLLDVSKGEISKLANFLKEYPKANAQIRGHVCCGNNLRISERRAKAVYKELVKSGIPKDRLTFVGMSNKEPLVFPELTSADRQKNRRVDVRLTLRQ